MHKVLRTTTIAAATAAAALLLASPFAHAGGVDGGRIETISPFPTFAACNDFVDNFERDRPGTSGFCVGRGPFTAVIDLG